MDIDTLWSFSMVIHFKILSFQEKMKQWLDEDQLQMATKIVKRKKVTL